MTDTTIKVREHYGATGLTDRIKSALGTIAPEGQTLTIPQLAPLDQFHTCGILATAELSEAAGIEPSNHRLGLLSAVLSSVEDNEVPIPSAVRGNNAPDWHAIHAPGFANRFPLFKDLPV